MTGSTKGPSVPPAAELRSHLPGLVALLGLALCWWGWFDEGWFAPDEGNYAHVADRILAGEVLHRDVQDIHAGYVNLTHAGAFAVFGRSMLALRAPIVFMNLVQATLAYVVVARRAGPWAGALAALALGVLTTPVFLNPSANWYSLCLTVVAIAVADLAADRPQRDVGLGLVVGLTMGFRQLSGVFLLAGILTWRLQNPASEKGTPLLARASGATVFAVVGAYLAKTADAADWVLFGIGALATVFAATWRSEWSNRAWLGVLSRVGVGGVISAIPLFTYHAAHGSLREWVRDVVIVATGFPALPFFEGPSQLYTVLAVPMVSHLNDGLDAVSLLTAVSWTLLALAAIPVGLAAVRQLNGGDDVAPLIIVAACYAPVSAHYGTPAYLSFSAGLSVAACLELAWRQPSMRPMMGTLVGAVVAVFIAFQGGATAGRTVAEVLGGHRVPHAPLSSPRAGLMVPVDEAIAYDAFVRQIQEEVPADRSIFILPSRAEFYFLTERRNPTKFFNSAIGLFDASHIVDARRALVADPPVLILWDPEDKSVTPAARELVKELLVDYDRLPIEHDFDMEVWKRKASP